MIVDHVNAGDEVLQIASGLRSKLSRRDLQGLQSVCLAGLDDSTLNTGIDVDNGDGFGTDGFSVRAHADDDAGNVENQGALLGRSNLSLPAREPSRLS